MKTNTFRGKLYSVKACADLSGEELQKLADACAMVSRAPSTELGASLRAVAEIIAPELADDFEENFSSDEKVRFCRLLFDADLTRDLDPASTNLAALNRLVGAGERMKRKGFQRRLDAWVYPKT